MSGIEYSGANLEAIYHGEGRCTPNGATAFFYEYTVKDHLGNARVNFRANGTTVTFLEELHYYPFGLQMEGIGTAATTQNKYRYNGKEINDDFGLNWSDYGARWYDASLGRWWSVDPLAEPQANYSPYAYTYNNPLSFIDPTGMMGEGADGLSNEQWLDQSRKDGGYWEQAKKGMQINTNRPIQDLNGNTRFIGDDDLDEDAQVTPYGTRVYIKGKLMRDVLEGYYIERTGNFNPRPSFKELWDNYLDYKTYPDAKFAEVVGGKYLFNYSTNENFANTCAVRVSYCLNKAGYKIPKHEKNANGSYNTSSGSDKDIYYFKTTALKSYLIRTYGKPEIISTNMKDFDGKKGIIFFDIRIWDDAAGHFTLWNGSAIKGGNHPSEYYFKNATQVYLWNLK